MSTPITIQHHPSRQFSVFFSTFAVDFHNQCKIRAPYFAKNSEELTNKEALKIFRSVKLQFDVSAFFAKAIVLIPVGAAAWIAGMALPVTSVAAVIGGFALCTIGLGMVGWAITNHCNGLLPALSKAYSAQSRQLTGYIAQIEAAGIGTKVVLA